MIVPEVHHVYVLSTISLHQSIETLLDPDRLTNRLFIPYSGRALLGFSQTVPHVLRLEPIFPLIRLDGD